MTLGMMLSAGKCSCQLGIDRFSYNYWYIPGLSCARSPDALSSNDRVAKRGSNHATAQYFVDVVVSQPFHSHLRELLGRLGIMHEESWSKGYRGVRKMSRLSIKRTKVYVDQNMLERPLSFIMRTRYGKSAPSFEYQSSWVR
jgi:hypothetical protein